jgi:hypothetical protein
MAKLKVISTKRKPGPNPARDLGKHGAALWRRIAQEYDISDAAGRELLLLAAEALDRATSLREQIDRDGEVIVVKGAMRDNPLLKHELQNRSFISKALARLDLEVPKKRPIGRPLAGGLGITSIDTMGTDDD